MADNRTKNSVRNISWAAINNVASVLFPFFIRTIMIREIGEEGMGLITLYKSIIEVMNITDLGIKTAINASLYKPIAENNKELICNILNLFKKMYMWIAVVLCTIGIIIIPFLKYMIEGDIPAGINIYFLWILYLILSASGYLYAYYISFLDANQRVDVGYKIFIVIRVFEFTLQYIAVVSFKNVYLYVIARILSTVIYAFICKFECRRRHPGCEPRGNLDPVVRGTITKEIKALAIQKIGKTVSISLDAIFISAFLGLTTVAIYGNYNYIIQAVSVFVMMIGTSIVSSIGNSIVSNTVEKNYSDFRKIFFLNSWITGWCCICFICLFKDFMVIWMGEKLLFSSAIVVTLVLRFYFEIIRNTVLTYKDALGLWSADQWKPIVGCLVNLVLNVILVKSIGVAGVAISTIISFAFIELPWETRTLFKHYFGCSERGYYMEMIGSIVRMLVAAIGTYYVCLYISGEGIWVLTLKLCVCLIIPNLIFIILNYKNNDFLEAMALVKKIKDVFI